jgi:hypothetical protein
VPDQGVLVCREGEEERKTKVGQQSREKLREEKIHNYFCQLDES